MKIKRFFSAASFLWPMAKSFLTQEGSKVREVAEGVVQELEKTPMTGANKRREAVRLIKQAVGDVSNLVINAAIEAALFKLRGKDG